MQDHTSATHHASDPNPGRHPRQGEHIEGDGAEAHVHDADRQSEEANKPVNQTEPGKHDRVSAT